MKKTTKSVRLPSHIKPERYKIMLKPDLEGFIFNGEETIFLNIEKPTKEITLHSKEINIQRASFKNFKFQISNFKIGYNEKDETVTLSSEKLIPKGKGELKLVFNGILNDKMRGFYRSRYEHNGKTKYMATTQFEATDARRAFPCFDEPAQKAIFDVTLLIPNETTAISNTIETSIERKKDHKVVRFAPTPKMSTYLLAFIVGEFEWLEGTARINTDIKTNKHGKENQGTLVRVFTTPGKKEQGKFALDCAIKTLEFYNKYFNIPYPLPVLDLIAIPDFTSGAMENWGAVTYRESALLVDPANSSSANKQWVALVIAHELAHQWFGNLVTMEWWTELWLNEGFASYIEYLAVNELFPSWDIWTQFAYNDLGVALNLDGLKNTHPIEVEVHHPDEIGEIFDAVSYSKGSSVIRMLAEYLGEENFRNGLRYYLKKHAYGNTKTVDLWQAFEKISKRPVTKIMQNWTSKPGYPLVKITEEKNKLKLTQSRFFSSAISRKQSSDNTVWSVPVSYESNNSKQLNKFLLDKKFIEIKKPSGSWTKFNVGETSFFRTDYPAQMLAALRKPIENKQLSPIDRLGIIRDAFALTQTGQLPAVQALELLKAYKNETDYTVWVELVTGLGYLDQLLAEEKFYPQFESYARNIFTNIAKKVGFEKRAGEKHTEGLLRSIVLAQVGSFGDQKTISHFQKLFRQYKKSGKKIAPDLRGAMYHVVAKTGGNQEFNFLVSEYKKETLHEEKNRIGRALGSFRNPEILQKALKFAMSNAVRSQDMPSILVNVWSNPKGRNLAWEFLKQNIKSIMDRYALGGHMLSRMLGPAGHFTTEARAKEIETFFKKTPAPGATRTIQQVLERIRGNVLWLNTEKGHLEKWLAEND